MAINPAKIQGVLSKASDQQLMQMLQRPDKIPSMFIQQEIARRKQMRQAQKAEQASLNLPPSEMAQQGTQVPRQQMQMQSPIKMGRGGRPEYGDLTDPKNAFPGSSLNYGDPVRERVEVDPLGLNLPVGPSALEQLQAKIGPINQVLKGGATVPLANNQPSAINLNVGTSVEEMAPIEIPDMLQNYRRVLEKEATKNNSEAFESSEIQNQLAKSIQTDELKLNNINPLELISQKIAPQRLETRAATRPTNLSPAQIGAMRTNRQDQQLSNLTSAPASQTNNSGVRSLLDTPPANVARQSINTFKEPLMNRVLPFAKQYKKSTEKKPLIERPVEENPFADQIQNIIKNNNGGDIDALDRFGKYLVRKKQNVRNPNDNKDDYYEMNSNPPFARKPDNATLNSFTTSKAIDEKTEIAKEEGVLPEDWYEMNSTSSGITSQSNSGITSQSKNKKIFSDNKSPGMESILNTIKSIGNSDSPDSPEAKQFKLNDEKLQSLQQGLMDAMKPQASASQRFFQLVSEFGAKVASSDRPGFMAAAGQAMDETMKSMQGMRDEDRAMFIKRAQLGVEFELSRRQNDLDMMKFMAERNDAGAIRELRKNELLLRAASDNQTFGLNLDKAAETERSNLVNEKILRDRIEQDRVEASNVANRNKITSLADALKILQEQAQDSMTDPERIPQLQNDITSIINEMQRLGGITPSTAPVVDKIFE
jgi:hypothetical protein